MAKVLVTEDYLSDIGDAIRGKLGGSTQYTPGQMASAISSIPTVSPTLISKSISANGTYNADDDNADGYDSVSVNVPNSYSAQDEGKVVSSGALVAQESQNVSQNGTYDTTLKNQVVVAVPNSYSASDEGKVVSSGELVAQTSRNVTENGTYDTTENNEIIVNVSGGGGGVNISPVELTFYTGANINDGNFIAYFDGMFIHVMGRIALTSSFSTSSPIFKIPNTYTIPAKQPIWFGKTNNSGVGIIDENGDFYVSATQSAYIYIDAQIYATKGNIVQITPDTSKFTMDSGGIVQYGSLQVAVAYGKFKTSNQWVADFLDFLGDVIISKKVESSSLKYPDTATNYGEAIGVFPNSTSNFYSVVIIKDNSE